METNQKITITGITGFEIEIDAGTNCSGYSGFNSGERIVSPTGYHGTFMGIGIVGGALLHDWTYIPGGMAAWIILDKDVERASYVVLGDPVRGFETLIKQGYVTETEFETRKQELSQKRGYLLKHGWLEASSIYGDLILVNTNKDVCQKFNYHSGQIIQATSKRVIIIVGIAPKSKGIFGEEVLWCKLEEDGQIMSWDDANFITKANTLCDIFSGLYKTENK
jgi:hypothetical protein